MSILFGISLTINILLILFIVIYFKLKKKYSFIFDLFNSSTNKKDDSIVDESLAKDFFGDSIFK